MQHVMPAHLAARQHMVLAAIDQLQRNAQRLHHRRTRVAQIVRRPLAVGIGGQHQRVVIAPILQRRARHAVLVLFEHRLAVADLFADLLPHDIAIVVLSIIPVLLPPLTTRQTALQRIPPAGYFLPK